MSLLYSNKNFLGDLVCQTDSEGPIYCYNGKD